MAKYNLLEFLEGFDRKRHFPSCHVRKSIVKNAIKAHEQNEWTVRVTKNIDFSCFKEIQPAIKPHRTWKIALYCPHLHNLLNIGSH